MAEMGKVDAALVLDTGTGKVFSIALEDQYEPTALMNEIYAPLASVFDLQPLSTRNFGSILWRAQEPTVMGGGMSLWPKSNS